MHVQVFKKLVRLINKNVADTPTFYNEMLDILYHYENDIESVSYFRICDDEDIKIELEDTY